MKPILHRLISLMLVLTICGFSILMFFLYKTRDTSPQEESVTESDAEQQDTELQKTDPVVTEFDLSKFEIVIPLNDTEGEMDAVITLKSSLKTNYGIDISIRDSENNSPKIYEILVGRTEYAESLAVLNSLSKKDYAVKVVGNKIVIVGGTGEATAAAVEYFLANCIKKENDMCKVPVEFNYEYKYDYNDEETPNKDESGLPAEKNVPDYVIAEAEKVADKILSVRNNNTFVMTCISDLHTSGNDQSAIGVYHAGQAMDEIQSLTELGLVAVLGDVAVGDFDESAIEGFNYVKKCFENIAKDVPYIQLQGNHDELPSDTTEEARDKYYSFIGGNNVVTVVDYENKFRNYGYRDFENYKIRVIYINTVDVSEYEMTYDNHFTYEQMNWFINTALNMSVKDDPAEWGVIVLGHHPLNWTASGDGSITKVLDVLDAYKGRESGRFTLDGQSINYDFSDETSEFICHIHGHLHNFREEVLGRNGILSITVPNASFFRSNEYGNYDYDTYPEIVKRYGDDGANNDGTVTQRTYVKTSDTADDTAFSVFCIDRESKTINVFNYGAGIDRKWDYHNGIKCEVIQDDDNTGEDGYKTGCRVNSSGVEAVQDGMCCTGYIEYTDGQIIRLKNVTVTGTKSPYLVQYNQDKTYFQVVALDTALPDDGTGVLTGSLSSFTGWIRITCGVIDDTSILTLD